MLLVAFATTALAGPALAYKTLVLDQPQDEVQCASGPRAAVDNQPPVPSALMQVLECDLEIVLDVVPQVRLTVLRQPRPAHRGNLAHPCCGYLTPGPCSPR